MTRLDAIRARVKAATPGPWRYQYANSHSGRNFGDIICGDYRAGQATEEDALLCVHAPADLNALLAVAEAAFKIDSRIVLTLYDGGTSQVHMASGWQSVQAASELRSALVPLVQDVPR